AEPGVGDDDPREASAVEQLLGRPAVDQDLRPVAQRQGALAVRLDPQLHALRRLQPPGDPAGVTMRPQDPQTHGRMLTRPPRRRRPRRTVSDVSRSGTAPGRRAATPRARYRWPS